MTQQINLLERSLLPRRGWVTGGRVLLGAGLVAGLMLGQYAYEHMAMARLLQAETSAASVGGEPQPTVAELEPLIAVAEARVRQSEALIGAAAALADLPQDNGPRLQRLFAALPESVWLQQVRFAAGGQVQLVGGAQRPADLVGLSEALGRTPGFERMPVQVFSLDQARSDDDATHAAAPRPPRPRWFGFEMSSHPGQAADTGEVPR